MYDDSDPECTQEPWDVELDPVEADLVGGALLEAMKRDLADGAQGWKFGGKAINFIKSLDDFVAICNPPTQYVRKAVSTQGEYASHMKELRRVGIVALVPEGTARFISTYFAILKTNGLARAIFNGKRFSNLCQPPPPTKLPDITRVLRAMERLAMDSRPALIVGDLKHCFHQYGLNPEIAKFFGLRTALGDFLWRTLPMGFSYSPWVAQCIGFTLMMETLRLCGYDVSKYIGEEDPPEYVAIYDADGKLEVVAALWYDNVMFFVRDASRASKVKSTFQRLCNRYHIVLKELELFGTRSFFQADSMDHNATLIRPNYLGVEFRMIGTRGSGAEGTDSKGTDSMPSHHWHLTWRMTRDKREKWSSLKEKLGGVLTYQWVARIAGVILWSAHIRLQPLCRHSAILEMVKKCGVECRAKHDWLKTVTLTPRERDTLISGIATSVDCTWATVSQMTPLGTILCAADSSGLRRGHVVWSESRQLLDIQSHPWSGAMTTASIFIKELTAAVLLIEELCQLYPRHNIFLVEDNTAAAAVLEKLASSTKDGNELAMRVDRVLTASHCMLGIVRAPSRHNAADSPSRGVTLDPERVRLTFVAISRHLDGLGGKSADAGSYLTSSSIPRHQVRHPETDNTSGTEVDSDEDDHSEWSELDTDDEEPII
jgi:hypothetical protein